MPHAANMRLVLNAGEVELEALDVRGVLRQLARDSQLIDVRCEMPSATASGVGGTSRPDRR